MCCASQADDVQQVSGAFAFKFEQLDLTSAQLASNSTTPNSRIVVFDESPKRVSHFYICDMLYHRIAVFYEAPLKLHNPTANFEQCEFVPAHHSTLTRTSSSSDLQTRHVADRFDKLVMHVFALHYNVVIVDAIIPSTVPSLIDTRFGIFAASYWLMIQIFYLHSSLYLQDNRPIKSRTRKTHVITTGGDRGLRVRRFPTYKITCGFAWRIARALLHDAALRISRAG